MKLNTKNLKLSQLLLFVTANLLLVSCGTYKSVYNDDGIYGDKSNENEEKKVIVVSDKEYRDYDNNYFTKELERLNTLENNEIFTDVETYNSDDEYFEDDIIDTLNYNSRQPWGFEDNNVVVNVNLINDPFWGGGFNNWGWGFNNGWGLNNGWGFNTDWGFYSGWGNPFWGNRFWGYNPYWHPYHNNWAWNGGFYNPYWRNNNFWNNNYNRNNSYGRRVTSNANGRRNNSANSRLSSNNRYNSNTGRSSNSITRNSNISGTRNSSTIRSSSS
ncbi:MAG: hypothetical protein WBF67_01360, partial [Olleya sp.]